MRAFPLLLACSVVVSGPVVASAQSDVVVAGTTPAEVPPSAFNGRQYVDSAGCVFVRAGQGDVVAWMPRLTRSNEPLCGYAPTNIEATQRPETAAVTAASATPTATQLASVKEVTLVSAPRLGASNTSPVLIATATDVVMRPATRAACGATALRLGHRIGCDTASEDGSSNLVAIQIPPQTRNSTHGLEGLNGKDLRRTAPARIVVASDATYSFSPSAQGTVIVGSAETAKRLSRDTQRIAVPRGYKEAWTDGRLNVFRGVGTDNGTSQMRRTWTESVPQRLIEQDD